MYEFQKIDNPLISVIIPVYNAEAFIEECINSIINQTYNNWEMLLVDDGSIDKSRMICERKASNDNRIRVFHQENKGVSSARNLALDNIKGEWVTFVDSDDIIDPQYIESLYITAKKYHADMVGCRIARFVKSEDIKSLYIEKLEDHIEIWDRFTAIKRAQEVDKYSANVSNKLMRSSLINNGENTENIRFHQDIYYGEDMLFYFTTALHINCFAGVDLPLYLYRENEASAISVIWNKKWDSVLVAYKRLMEMLKEYDNGKFLPHISYQEACVSLFLRRFTTGNPMDKNMKSNVRKVVKDRLIYLLLSPHIHRDIKLAALPLAIHPKLAEIEYSFFLKIKSNKNSH